MRRCWTEIDLNTILNNYKIYARKTEELAQRNPNNFGQSEIMAVVKADAYGHGDVQVAQLLQKNGCRNFAVSNIYEAKKLRKANIQGQILILGYTQLHKLDDLVKFDITQTLIDEEYAGKLAGRGIKAQVAIDTGMNRIGLDADKPELCEKSIRQFAGQFNLTGMFTHLCVADTPSEDDFTNGQIEKFDTVVKRVQDLNLPYIHCMNSAGGLWQTPYGNLVRLGAVLYGLKPDYANSLPEGIKTALAWKTVVSMIKTVHKGETIGYGRSFRAEKDIRVATISTGYADGYSRALSNKGCVYIRGKKAPIVGRICMDQFMADVTDIPEAAQEDEVILLGEKYTADDMAHDAGTIGYEIVCDISPRVVRVYND